MTSRMPPEPVPLRRLGTTGVEVSALGLGGYHIGSIGTERQAISLIRMAIDEGITFLDNAWEYHEGKSETRMGKALAGGWRERAFLMTKCCTHGRDGKTAMRQLEQSLKRLRTDYLDLWQIHEVVYATDPARHFAPGGAAEALLKAKEQGKVRFIGFTGHKDPALHLEMLSHEFPFDTCQLPLNCFDASFRSFERRVLPELHAQGIAPIGMKSLGDGRAVKKRAVSAAEALAYAMSLPVATTVSGIDSMRVLRQNLRVAQGFEPLSDIEMQRLRSRVSEVAHDGRFELYKTTATHDGKIGRQEHGFPDEEELGG